MMPQEQAQEAVLRKVRDKESRPLDLLESLGKNGYSSGDLKLAVAQLLHNGQIELTSSRTLRTAPAGE